MADWPTIIPALPEIFLALAGMAVLMVGVFAREGHAVRVSNLLSLIALGIALVLVIFVSGGTMMAFGNLFVTDGFATYMKSLVLLGSILAVLMSQEYFEQEGAARFEFPVLILFATLGMLMMVSANNLISLYLGVELQSLCLYVVAAIRRDSLRSSEAGLKYFVLGALSSGMLLYGASLIYGFTGTTDFATLARVFAEGHGSPGIVIGLVFLIAGLAFKVSAVPFHMWTPDVYEGAPTPVTAFFSVAPKIASLALFIRVMLEPFGPLAGDWQQIIVMIAIASMALGAFAAIVQTNIKRLMAYSSIGHVGYALVGLAAGTETGVFAMLVYLAIYLVMNIGTFACILSMRRHGDAVENIDDLSGLSKTNPRMALALGLLLFSLAGIPWMAGFFGKFYIFMAAIEAELYTLSVLGVLTSVVAAYYYLRIVKIMYFDEAAEAFDRPTSRLLPTVIAVAAIFVALFIFYPAPLLNSAGAAAATLFAG